MTDTSVEAFSAIDRLPAAAAALLDGAGSARLFTSRPWFESFISAGMASGTEALFLMLGGGRALLPCLRRPGGDPGASSLTSFYSCDFRPLIAPDVDPAMAAEALGGAAMKLFAGEAVVAFDSLDATLPSLAPFLAGLAWPGRALLRYAHFGRWWEDVAGRGFEAYLAARDGALRETIRRKGARLDRAGARLTMIDAGSAAEEVERGIADYETVYKASWKEPEPFPAFQPTLMRNLARTGWLRLALCHLDGRPAAAQLWTRVGGTATVLKLAHDRSHDDFSPGTVLTAFAIRALMAEGGVERLDFGRGDDGYKRAWTTRRTSHIGVVSVDVARRPALVARHWIGGLIRRARGGDSAA